VLLTEAGRIVSEPSEPVLADDRSSLFEEIVLALRSGGNEAAAMDMAMRWRDFGGGSRRAVSLAPRVKCILLERTNHPG